MRASVIANSAIRARRLRPETLDRVAALEKAVTRAARDHSGSGAFIARVRHQCLAQKVSRISAPNATKTRTGIALTRNAVLDAELAIGKRWRANNAPSAIGIEMPPWKSEHAKARHQKSAAWNLKGILDFVIP
jgi:hypothetical protein